MADAAVRVQGLRELQRAFRVADKELAKELRGTLREVAEPVRAEAEQLAVTRISRMTVPWSRMRVGVTQSTVYVAPRRKGVRGRSHPRSRPNLFDLLMGRSLQPALDHNEQRIEQAVDRMLVEVGRDWERV